MSPKYYNGENAAAHGEKEYARLAGIIIAGNLLLFTAGNFSMVLAVAVVSVILSVFLKKAS